MKPKLPQSKPGAGLEGWREDETLTMCPACQFGQVRCHVCKGGGFQEIKQIGPSRYATLRCDYCKGARAWKCSYCGGTGMVSAARASTWRKMQAVKDPGKPAG